MKNTIKVQEEEPSRGDGFIGGASCRAFGRHWRSLGFSGYMGLGFPPLVTFYFERVEVGELLDGCGASALVM